VCPTDHPDGVRAVLITTTAIELPIDIKTCTATLKVDITAQTVGKIAISIAAADITGNIPIDIAAQAVGNIGIDIKAQTVAQLNVNIAASAVTLNVNISSQTAALNVNIAASAVTLNVNISSQTANLNVNIAASAATITVSVTGTANISINAQTVGIHIESEWEVKQGMDKNYYGESGASSGVATDFSVIAVDAGKTLYIVEWGWVMQVDAGFYGAIVKQLQADPFTKTVLSHSGGRMGFSVIEPMPIAIAGPINVLARVYQLTGNEVGVAFSFRGYEL